MAAGEGAGRGERRPRQPVGWGGREAGRAASGGRGAGGGARGRSPAPPPERGDVCGGEGGPGAACGTGAPNMSALLAALRVRERAAATAAGGGQRGAARA